MYSTKNDNFLENVVQFLLENGYGRYYLDEFTHG
jgi:hypothetical protein